MELQRLVLEADSEMVNRISRYTRLDCAILNETTSFEAGTAIIIVRANSARSVEKGMAAIRSASACQAPVIVVAGFNDTIGNAYLKEAKKCGVPGECILLVKGSTVVDAVGNKVGNVLRGNGIGVNTALAVAAHSLENNLLPEVSIRDGSDVSEAEDGPDEESEAAGETTIEEIAVAQATAPAATAKTAPVQTAPAKAVPAKMIFAKETTAEAVVAEAAATSDQAAKAPVMESKAGVATLLASPAQTIYPWYGFIEQAEKIVAVFGVKNGAGASLVAACLTGRLSDRNSLYLEVGPTASGYPYYGRSPEEAARAGKYAYCDHNTLIGNMRSAQVLIADVCFPEAMDMVYQKASYVVVVTDGSTLGFEKTQNWIKSGRRVDTLVVNKVLYGSSYPPEVYIREFKTNEVIGIPGGNEEKVAIHIAQRKGILPFGRSADLDNAIKSLAGKILGTFK